MAGNLTSQGNSDRLWRPPTCRIPSRSTNGSSLEDKWFFAIQGDSDAPVMGAVNTGAVSKESHQSKLEKSETDCVPYACANINYFISFLQRNDNTTEKRKHEEDGDDEDTEMLARCGVTKYNRCHKKKTNYEFIKPVIASLIDVSGTDDCYKCHKCRSLCLLDYWTNHGDGDEQEEHGRFCYL